MSALSALFRPRSIAIVGASQDPAKIGGRPVQTLRALGYEGTIFPVNARGGEVQGLRAFRAMSELPQPADLALIAVPAVSVPQAIAECGAAGTHTAVVFTSGFAETGASGEQLQATLKETAQRAGVRVLGPNCLGAMSFPDRAFATFSIALQGGAVKPGPIGIVSQSGNIGAYLLLLARERGIGLSRWVATGNECDIDVADCLEWMADDPQTRVILCCLETCRNAERLIGAFEAARRMGKPVVVLKAGASIVGQAAAHSHTGAMAGSDAVFGAVFRQFGVLRAARIEELLDIGQAVADLPASGLPRGNRLGIYTLSGGFGVLAADAATTAGLEIPELSRETQRRILELVPFAGSRNPVDATAHVTGQPELFERTLDIVLQDEQIDTLLVFLTSSPYVERLRTIFESTFRNLRRKYANRLIVVSAHGPETFTAFLRSEQYVVVDGTDRACTVIGALAQLGAALRRPPAEALSPLPPTRAPRTECADERAAKQLLAGWGIPVVADRLAKTAEGAVDAAVAFGFPVALKIASPDIAHKTEVGGVALDLRTPDEVRRAFDEMMTRVRALAPAARIDGVLVTRMVKDGTETILGVTRDPIFGPVVMFGLGGVFAEVLKDVTFRKAPFDEAEARRMIREIKSFAILDGARGRPRADLSALAAALAALSRLAAAMADNVAEVDVNPFVVLPEGQGALALDALVVARG
ncbi:MAG TPA: acetate--CoA ligase family protein [Burkholderiales bacterium]|nr:acetate--CoA ligase family protein [Burkholderiales bacterium]